MNGTVRDSGFFSRLLNEVAQASPLQRKSLASLPLEDPVYLRRAERFAEGLIRLLAEDGLGPEAAARAYLDLCRELMVGMARFQRTGAYECADSIEAGSKVYHRPERMTPYLLGLALSQFLWPNHYALLDFFLETCDRLPSPSRILEIGPGHGLYLAESLMRFPQAEAVAVDVSQAALDLARRTLAVWAPGAVGDRCRFFMKDAMELSEDRYDLVVMGEVLEHVDRPTELLAAVRRVMAPHGHLFLTTCANCPAPDHVFLFHDVGEIRDLLRHGAFTILKERALPVDGNQIGRLQVNYGALAGLEDG